MAKTKARKRPVPPKPKKKSKGFSPAVKTFITAMIGHPNITRAYKLAYPTCKVTSAAANGNRMMRVDRVREAIEAGRAAKLKALEMDGDEALRRMALIARVDIRQLYDEAGELKPVHEWPDELALAVKAIEPGQHGTRVKFDSRLAALELVARADGKFTHKIELGADDDLAALLARHARPEERGE